MKSGGHDSRSPDFLLMKDQYQDGNCLMQGKFCGFPLTRDVDELAGHELM
jgi:hypothetical protein